MEVFKFSEGVNYPGPSLRSLAKIHLGQMECFELGNLDSMRDWGHARDYVEGGKIQ